MSRAALTLAAGAAQDIPALRDVQVGHGQGNALIHRPAAAPLAQAEDAAQLPVIQGAQPMAVGHQVLCQVLRGVNHIVHSNTDTF